jgi:subtilisin family serine protease
MLLRAALGILMSAATVLGLCEQGTGFDPNLKVIVNAVQMDPGAPSARRTLGRSAVKGLCDAMEVSAVFRCDSYWSDGMSGYAMSDKSIVAEAGARLPDLPGSIVFRLSTDVYYQNGVGLRSPPEDPTPRCIRSLMETRSRRLQSVPVYGPPSYSPPSYGDCEVKSQTDATDALSFMSAYKGAVASCFPRCQEAGEYQYTATGKGVTVYIVDQAVSNHSDISGSLSSDRYFSTIAQTTRDQTCSSWHGTHVAGLAAGDVYGVAKNATVVSVAIQPGCNQDGRASDLIAGLDWVLERHDRVGGPAVVSMSLVVTSSAAGAVLESMVRNMIEAGIVVVVAAGNFADDACNYMPANLDDVITVAALQLDTVRGVSYASPWASSNTGSCVTIWAPGAYVTSASSESATATAVYSGTSQATPMVSGLVAQFLQGNPTATSDVVRAHLINSSVRALSRVPIGTTAVVAQVAL